MKKIMAILLTALLFFVGAPSTFAFSDIANSPGKSQILALKERGIASGVSAHKFAPEAELTYAQAVAFITRAFDLSLAHIILEEGTSVKDFFTNIEDGKWYSEPFMNVYLNNIAIDQNVKPNDKVTKEVFTDLLFQAMTSKNDMAFIELYRTFADEDEVTPKRMNSVQKMIVSDIIPLENGYFYPQKILTRQDAAIMIYDTLQFVENFPFE